MRTKTLTLILPLLVCASSLVGITGSVNGLSCTMEERTLDQSIREADVVLLGTVVTGASSAGTANDSYITVRVDEAYKGVNSEEVRVYYDPTWGSGKSLAPGSKYLMLLNSRNGKISEPLCKTSFIVAGSTEHERYRQFLPKHADTTKPTVSEGIPISFLASIVILGIVAVGGLIVVLRRKPQA